MTEKNHWETFFDHHAPDYMSNVFTGNTEYEVSFVIEQLGLKPGMRVLDIGCGTCRHGVGLARHGLHMTGVDLSSGMLEQARQAAADSRARAT